MMNLKLSKDKSQPLYRQVVDTLAAAVVSGQLSPGQRLPAKGDLARQLGVSIMTLNQSYSLLERRGLIVQRQGDGTYIRPDALQQPVTADADQLVYDRLVVVIGASDMTCLTREEVYLNTDLMAGVYDVMDGKVGVIEYKPALDMQLIQSLPDRSAVILRKTDHIEPGVLDALHDRRIPIVQMWGTMKPGLMPLVHYDGHQAAQTAVEHLLDCGYRRIGFIGDMGSITPLAAKFFGFTNALYEAGLDYDIRHVRGLTDKITGPTFRGNYWGGAFVAAMEMVKAGHLPEALFVDADAKAMEVITALLYMGLKVPDDIAVMGYDDIPDAAKFHPPLSTMRSPRREIGRHTAQMLLDWTLHNKPMRSICLKSTLVVRDTTIMSAPPVPDSEPLAVR